MTLREVKRKQSLISVILLNRDISLNSPLKRKKNHYVTFMDSVNSRANCVIESIVSTTFFSTKMKINKG